MRVFFFAGEASGDAYAAAIVRELKKSGLDWQIEGVGGKALAAEGVNLMADSTTWGAIGIVDGAKVFFKVKRGADLAAKHLAQGEPGIFIPIDFGFANIKMSRRAKQLGWKVLYFIPPGNWRREKQGADMPEIADEIVTPFPWSAEILNKMGASAHFYGHPLQDLLTKTITERGEGIALLPGSRRSEIHELVPLFAQAVKGMPTAEFAVAHTVNLDALKAQWKALRPEREDTFTVGDVDGVLRRARVALVCSGTATLQAAIAQTPMVVVYKASRANMIQGQIIRMLRNVKFVSLPNIILDRELVPELLLEQATPSRVRAALDSLMQDGPARAAQISGLAEVGTLLGEPGCIAKTADLLAQMAKPSS